MPATGAALVPVGMGVLIAVLGIFAAIAYQFYDLGATWGGLAVFAAMIGVFVFLSHALKGLFAKYTGRMIFGTWMIALLGAYFGYLAIKDKYPMGIDLAGGTELIYVLDYSPTDRNIEKAEISRVDAAKKDPNSKEVKDIDLQIEALHAARASAPDKAAEVIRRRVDPTGTKGIPVTTLGRDRERLRIQLPEAPQEEVDRIKKAIQTQGRLTFHIVGDNEVEQMVSRKKSMTPPQEDPIWEIKTIKTPKKIRTEEFSTEEIVVKRIPDMEGSQITYARAQPGREGNAWEIIVRFSPSGAAEFSRLTGANIGKRLATVLDNECKIAPTIQSQIAAECQITGNFTEKEAEEIAKVLTAGSLPADVKLDNELTVGPSLGEVQIRDGMRATVIATLIVIAFMCFYYRTAGFIAAFCMVLNVPMLMGLMGFFKATLTLPGIAGIVLTLGMAVDANVLINERLREELQRGRSLKLAVSHGFERAFLTIIDCHLTTLISSIVLYYLGTGPVRGFAVTLSLGILTTLFCNLWLNWIIMEWLVGREALGNLKMMQFFKETKIDFMGMRKTWMTVTAAIAAVSLALFVGRAATGGRLFDVDFTGGSLVQFQFAKGKAVTDDQVKEAVEKDVRAIALKKVDDLVLLLEKNTGKSGTELKAALASIPNGDALAKDADSRKGGMAEIVKEINEERTRLTKVDLATQSFQAAGSDEANHKSYTLSAQIINPVVADQLTLALREKFKDTLEPEAVVPTETGLIVRFKDTKKTKEQAQAALKDAVAVAVKDPTNSAAISHLGALKVDKVEEKDGYLVAEITPLPADPVAKANVLKALDLTKIAGAIEGPITRTSSFGSQVADEMGKHSILALMIANLGIFIYLWFRFEFSGAWGFGAIVALLHDVIIAIGAVTLANMLGFPILFNLNIVAALLTITGFSVNDTIVVFDRIREVKAAHPTRSYEDIVNEAVNSTLSRTVLTAVTVILADLALLIFGGPTIKDMAFTLLVGFIVGMYSSIFIASPLMIWWYRRFGAAAPAPARKETAIKGDAPSGAQV